MFGWRKKNVDAYNKVATLFYLHVVFFSILNLKSIYSTEMDNFVANRQ